MLQSYSDTKKNNQSAAIKKTKKTIDNYYQIFLPANKSDSYYNPNVFSGFNMKNYPIGSDTSQSDQMISGLSELQSCFKLLGYDQKGPKKTPRGKNTSVVVSDIFNRFGVSGAVLLTPLAFIK